MFVYFLSEFANGSGCSDGKEEAQGAVPCAEAHSPKHIALIDVVDIDKISEIGRRHNCE